MRTQLLGMVSKEEEPDRQMNFRTLLHTCIHQSYAIKKETNNLPFICLLQLFRKFVLNLCLILGQGTETETKVATEGKEKA